jgi:hypothetical protein
VLLLSLLLAATTPSVEVLVLVPEAAEVDAEGRAALTLALTSALDGRNGQRVTSIVDVQQLADIEASREAAACADDSNCLAEIGEAFGARQMVAGRVARVGHQLVWQSTLLDVRSGVAVRREQTTAPDLAGLVAQAPVVARGLLPIPMSTTKLAALGGGGGALAVGVLTAGVFGAWTFAIADALERPTSAQAQAQAYADSAWVPWVFVAGAATAVVGGGAVVVGSIIE